MSFMPGDSAPQLPIDLVATVEQFDGPAVVAFAVMGSYARGEAGGHSDVDLVRFLEGSSPADLPPAGSYLETHGAGETLLVVSDVDPNAVEACFSDPESITTYLAGLRSARPVLDRKGYLARVQQRALDFSWTEELIASRVAAAARAMVGWIEEAHKGLQGLARGHVGRLLNARFGLSWGLTRVVKLHRGILLSGDNGTYDETAQVMGRDSEWCRLRDSAFGIGPEDGLPGLGEQVRAGLSLYLLTAALFEEEPAPPEVEMALIRRTCALIERSLAC